MCGWGLLTDSYYSCENEMISMSRAWDKEKIWVPDRIIPFFSFLTEKRVVFVFTLRASDPWRRSSAVGSCLVPSLFFSLYNINGQYWWEKHGHELFDHRLKCLCVSAFKLVQLLCLKVIPLYIQLRRVEEKYRRLCSGVGGGGGGVGEKQVCVPDFEKLHLRLGSYSSLSNLATLQI